MLRLLAVTAVVFGCATLALASEVGPAAPELDWIKTIGIVGGTIGGPLFAVWYSYYMTAVRLPEIEKNQTDQVNALITNFRDDMKVLWESKAASDDKLAMALTGLKDALLKHAG